MRTAVDTVEEFWTWDLVQQIHTSASDDSISLFKRDFSSFLGVVNNSVYFMPSGHQGLEALLRFKKNKGTTVMLPAFNCKIVQNAINDAGLKTQLYDFSSLNGIFDWEQIADQINEDVGVIIVTHYFGVPIDFRPIIETCNSKNIIIIEDCAHTLGGYINGQQVGTIGDASIFSFNYDKPISLGWGGIVVVNNPSFFNDLDNQTYHIPNIDEELKLLKSFENWKKYRRKMIPYENISLTKLLRMFRIIRPNIFNRRENTSIGAIQSQLGRWCLSKYNQVIETRNLNSTRLSELIKKRTWAIDKNTSPAWLKQKVRIPETISLKNLSQILQRKGIRCGNFNWPNLLNGPGGYNFPFSSDIARNWIDLPVHQNMSDRNFDTIEKVLYN